MNRLTSDLDDRLQSACEPTGAGCAPIGSSSAVGGRRSRLRGSRRVAKRRRGLSLLEVILAIAVLGGALAAIGEIARLGLRAANFAQQQTIAVMIADSVMAEIAAGVQPAQSVGQANYEDASDWVYSVEVSGSEMPGLLQVMVLVQQDPAVTATPETFRLYRFVPDPEYVQELEEAAEQVF